MQDTDRIGGITLNYQFYKGEDTYSDGPVEDELYDIVRDHGRNEYPYIIEERSSWPVFYHLSPLRGNIVEWMPIEPTAKVLEVGSGCGAITRTLALKSAQVDCIDLSKKRSEINAYRNRDLTNVNITVGNFRDIEPHLATDYNYIFLIGVFEYGQGYIGTSRPYENFLNLLKRHLMPGGRIIIAIENRLGLKYLAGCREDHDAKYFSGIEGYPMSESTARTFSRNGLTRILKRVGIQEYHFYYPYPDYKFMTVMHSDRYLPQRGEFNDNVRNYDRDRLVLFNEKNAYDSMIDDRMYAEFANSFLVVIGQAFPTVYTKYSNDRAEEFKIRTDITLDNVGRIQIRKYPLTERARDHVSGMLDAYKTLSDRFRGSDLEVNDCTIDNRTGVAIFSFVNGVPLSTMMDECVARGDMEAFGRLFKEYLRRISYREDYPAADFDLIFQNILVNRSIWTIIDYEWTYGKKIPTREIAFRALYCYVQEDKKRSVIDLKKYYDYLGLSDADVQGLLEAEQGFQKYVTGERKSLVEIWKQIGNRSIIPDELAKENENAFSSDRIQVYIDKGSGFSETDSYFPDERYDAKQTVTLNIRIASGTRSVRVDPAFAPCIVTIKRLSWNGRTIGDNFSPVSLHPNGAWLSDDSIVFDTDDPLIEFGLGNETKERGENMLTVVMMMTMIPEEIAANLVGYQMDDEDAADAPAKESYNKEEEVLELVDLEDDEFEAIAVDSADEEEYEEEDVEEEYDDEDEEEEEEEEEDEEEEVIEEEEEAEEEIEEKPKKRLGFLSRFGRKRSSEDNYDEWDEDDDEYYEDDEED